VFGVISHIRRSKTTVQRSDATAETSRTAMLVESYSSFNLLATQESRAGNYFQDPLVFKEIIE